MTLNPAVLEDEVWITQTHYFKMAEHCAHYTGHWFGARDRAGIIERVRTFGRMIIDGEDGTLPPHNGSNIANIEGKSRPEDPIRAFRVRESNCFELVDGHHRASLAVVRGHDYIELRVVGEKWTYLQQLVLEGVQTGGRREIYQPIDAPEFDGEWPLVRACQDRFEMMQDYLARAGIPLVGLNVLDLACSYGWFLWQFQRLGAVPHGVERDTSPIEIGRIAYRLPENVVVCESVESFLAQEGTSYDVVLFLSILHHYAIGQESAGHDHSQPEQAVRWILSQLDRLTSRVLFLDSGEEHELWFRERLPGWNAERIAHIIRDNTSFDRVVALGTDRDIVSYPGNYARTLFACSRSNQ